jgi:LmbE family N-acetylglucosaminyl deacetylase
LSYRLMCMTAHPDDESGAFGGALLMARAAGVETTVICLTEGQAASNRGEAANGEELAQIRRSEFAAAGEILGVSRGEVLHYPDGKLAEVGFSELVGVFVERIRRWRPQVVLAFGGEGGVNLHRDHTISSLAATAAFHWAGRSAMFPEQLKEGLKPYWPQKLYYSATPFLVGRDEEAKANTCITPRSLTLELGEFTEKRLEAFRKHSTQAVLLDQHRDAWAGTEGAERYLLVATRRLEQANLDLAMFQGIVED